MKPKSHRLIGLETEYAVRIPSAASPDSRPRTHREIYEGVCRKLRKRLPAARADATEAAKMGWFLGTGGAVWYESLFPTTGVGLIEGATPECRGVRSLLACQRAQDRLLSEAAVECDAALLKNSHDTQGHIYGAQENYEFTLATGWTLRLWRAACIGLIAPLVFLCYLTLVPGVILLYLLQPLTLRIHQLRCLWLKTEEQRLRSKRFWVGLDDRFLSPTHDLPFGGYSARPLLWLVRLAALPVSCTMLLLLRITRMRHINRSLTAFLATRMLFAGAGRVTRNGSLLMAAKAEGIWSVNGLPEFLRPMLSIGQFVKPVLTVVRFAEILQPRQRIQIALGDSNLCEEAEYLRVGTTLLLIDLIDAHPETDLPQLRFPIFSMWQLNRDTTLTRQFRLKNGSRVTGLAIQRRYLAACEHYIETERPDDAEAQHILELWRDVLDSLESDPDRLIGRVDWVTKRFLLHEAGESLSVAARQKIDARYHELSDDGYFRQFEATGLHCRVLTDEEIEAAMRLPPEGTPATTRARLIREFAGKGLTVGWRKMSNGMTFDVPETASGE